MGRFAVGKYAYGISDRSGFRYRMKDMRKEWNGSLVGKDEYEPKHPQLEPKRRPTDAEALKDARPDRTEPAVQILLRPNSFKSQTAGSSIIIVTEPSHGRSTDDAVRFRKVMSFDGFTQATLEASSGYVITVIDENRYSIVVPGESATVGNTRGGGNHATAGSGTATPSTASTFDATNVTLDSATKTFDEG